MIGTLLLPQHVLIVPQYILFRTLGLVGGDWPYLPLLMPQFLATEAFFVFLMVQFMRGVPRELDEAARIDGAGPFGIFRHIILPLSRPALVTTAIFSFIWTWNDFFRQLVFLSQLEDYTVPVALTLFIDSTSQSAVRPDVRHVGAVAAAGLPVLRRVPADARRGDQHQWHQGLIPRTPASGGTGATSPATPPTWRCSASCWPWRRFHWSPPPRRSARPARRCTTGRVPAVGRRRVRTVRRFGRAVLPGAPVSLLALTGAALLAADLAALATGRVPGGPAALLVTALVAAGLAGYAGLVVVEVGGNGGGRWRASARSAARACLDAPTRWAALTGVIALAGLLTVLVTPVAVPILAGYTVAALHAVAGRQRFATGAAPVPAHPELP